jgi:hypothetical protein
MSLCPVYRLAGHLVLGGNGLEMGGSSFLSVGVVVAIVRRWFDANV